MTNYLFIWVLSLTVSSQFAFSWASLFVGATLIAAQTAPESPSSSSTTFKINESVEVYDTGIWKPAKVIERNGSPSTGILYRVAYDGFNQVFFHEWVSANRLRTPGDSATPEPPANQSVGVKVGNDTPSKAMIAARKQLQDLKQAAPPPLAIPNPQPNPQPNQVPASDQTPANHNPAAEVNTPSLTPINLAELPDSFAFTTDKPWTFAPSPNPTSLPTPPALPAFLTRQTRLMHQPIDVFDKSSVLQFSNTSAVILHFHAKPGDLPTARIELLDKIGQSSGVIKLPGGLLPIHVSQNGNTIWAKSVDASGLATSPTRLHAFARTGLRLQLIKAWELNSGTTAQPNITPIFSNETLGIFTLDEYLFALDLQTGNCLWKYNIGSFAKALPIHNSHILILDRASAKLIDGATGQPVSTAISPGMLIEKAFSSGPDNVVLRSGNLFWNFDLKSGTFSPPLGVGLQPDTSFTTSITPDSQLWIIGSFQYDSQNDRYRVVHRPADSPLSNDPISIITNKQSLMTAPLPMPSLAKADDNWSKPFSLSGQKVKLSITPSAADVTPQDIEEVTRHFTKLLSDMNATITPDAELVLSLTTRDEPGEQRTYRLTGSRSGETVTANIPIRVTTLTLQKNDSVLWSHEIKSAGQFFVSTRQGQTFEDALTQANRHDIRRATDVKLPTRLLLAQP